MNQESEKPSIEQWEACKTEIENLKKEVYHKAEQVLGEGVNYDWMYEKMQDFSQEVMKNVPNYGKHIAWHRIIGSSTNYERTPLLDLPSPYGAQEFYQRLLKELDNKEECQKYLTEKGY